MFGILLLLPTLTLLAVSVSLWLVYYQVVLETFTLFFFNSTN